MPRVETRVAVGEVVVRAGDVRVPGAEVRGVRAGVEGLAERVRQLPREVAREALLELDLEGVVVRVVVVRDHQVLAVPRVGPALVGPRGPQADLVVGDRDGDGTGRVHGETGKVARPRAPPVGGDLVDQDSSQVGESRRRRVERVVDDDDAPLRRGDREVRRRVLEEVRAVVADVAQPHRRLPAQLPLEADVPLRRPAASRAAGRPRGS